MVPLWPQLASGCVVVQAGCTDERAGKPISDMTAQGRADAPGRPAPQRVELLYFNGCPSTERFLPRLRELLERHQISDRLRLRLVETDEAAKRERFLGSPSVRVDDRDIEPGADARTDFGLKCRLYRTADGITGAPPDALLTAALS